MPAKKINTRKNYKRGGYNSKKMRGGAEPEGGELDVAAAEEDTIAAVAAAEDEVIKLCRLWHKRLDEDKDEPYKQKFMVAQHSTFLEGLIAFAGKTLCNLDNDFPENSAEQQIQKLIRYLKGINSESEKGISDTINAIIKRLIKKGPGDTYKVQMFGELLQLQGQFFPGGFAQWLRGNIKSHIPWIDRKELEGGLMEEYEKLAEAGKFVFSNEALDGSRFLSEEERESYKLHKFGKEFNSVFPSSNGLQEFTIDNETYSYIEKFVEGEEQPPAKYYTSHYSSSSERDVASNKWCKNLSSLLDELKENGKFGGFAGDINLYVTIDTRGGNFELRNGVQEALTNHNCTLTVPYHLLDKDTFRNKVHDQWHKVGKENEPAAAGGTPVAGGEQPGQLDSLIIIEPYVKGFDYQTLANSCHQVFFLPPIRNPDDSVSTNPDGSVSVRVIKPKDESNQDIEQVTKTPFNWGHRTVTDHFLVEGVNIAIHSGADIHGIGNAAKSLKVLNQDFEYLDGLKHLIEVIKFLNNIAERVAPIEQIEEAKSIALEEKMRLTSLEGGEAPPDEGDVPVEAGGTGGNAGGARRVKKSRKKRGRRGKKSKRGSRRN